VSERAGASLKVPGAARGHGGETREKKENVVTDRLASERAIEGLLKKMRESRW